MHAAMIALLGGQRGSLPNLPGEPASERRRWMALLGAVLVAYLGLAYAYVWVIQPRYGPDEPRHFAYVRRLVEKRSLPVRAGPIEEDGAHTLHPPLYYTLMAPVYLVASGLGETGAYRAIKAVSPLLLAAALLLFLATLGRLLPDRPFAVAAALTTVALLPEFQLEAAVMNNDGLAVLLGSALLWQLVRTVGQAPCTRQALLTGLLMALFVNTKATGWTLSPLFALALFLRARRAPEQTRSLLRDGLVGYGLLLLLGTWWYVRNHQLYGQPVPLDFGQFGELHPINLRTGAILTPIDVYTSGYVIHYGWRATEGLFQSFWGQIDWFREEYRPAIFGILLTLVIGSFFGWLKVALPHVRQFLTRRTPSRSEQTVEQIEATADLRTGPPHVRTNTESASTHTAVPTPCPAPSPGWLPAAAFGLLYLHTWYVATFLHQGFYQGGRYLMPAVFGASFLLAAGWEHMIPARARFPAAVVLAAAVFGLNILCLVELITVLNPKYVTP